MTLLSFLSLNVALATCGMPSVDPVQLGMTFDEMDVAMARFPGVVVMRELQGDGRTASEFSRITVHVVVTTSEGREIANSRKRGLPITFELDPYGFWAKVAWGMSKGERRVAAIPRDMAFGEFGVAGIVPPGADLWIEVEALDLAPPAPRKRG